MSHKKMKTLRRQVFFFCVIHGYFKITEKYPAYIKHLTCMDKGTKEYNFEVKFLALE